MSLRVTLGQEWVFLCSLSHFLVFFLSWVACARIPLSSLLFFFRQLSVLFFEALIHLSAMSKSKRSEYLLTFQVVSPRLTHQMMCSVQIPVDEIVTACDSVGALLYTYIHMESEVEEQELSRALGKLADHHGVTGSKTFGYDTIDSGSFDLVEHIDDHPGFQILVQHEARGNADFHRWTADGYPEAGCGYNFLKARLTGRRLSQQSGASSSGVSVFADDVGSLSYGEDVVPASGNSVQDCERSVSESSKRKRGSSPPIGAFGLAGADPAEPGMVGLMRTVVEDSIKQRIYACEEMKRRGDAVSELKERVIILNYELNMAKESVKGAAATTERLQMAEREVSEQRKIAEEALTSKQRLEAELVVVRGEVNKKLAEELASQMSVAWAAWEAEKTELLQKMTVSEERVSKLQVLCCGESQ
jgi:hypothetical protein